VTGPGETVELLPPWPHGATGTVVRAEDDGRIAVRFDCRSALPPDKQVILVYPQDIRPCLDPRKNARRFELINKEMDDGELTAEEATELESLEQWCDEAMDKICPLPEPPAIGGEE